MPCYVDCDMLIRIATQNFFQYSMATESTRILNQHLLNDTRLSIPQSISSNAHLVKFTPDREPFYPTNLKISESSASLWALLGLFAGKISEERYGVEVKQINVDLYSSSLFLMSALIFTGDGKGVWDPFLSSRAKGFDLGNIRDPYRSVATNIYKTKDGKYYHLHGSLDTSATLDMLGLPQFNPELAKNPAEAVELFKTEVAKYDSDWLQLEANEHYRQAGTIVYKKEEFAQTEHGKLITQEPLYNVYPVAESIPPAKWTESMDKRKRPLAGIRVLDLTRVIAGPTVSRILSLLGADVLRISNSKLPDTVLLFDTQIGKRDTEINLKSLEGKRVMKKLVEEADIIVDGYRPGALERLGFGRAWVQEVAKRRGKGYVYARENCYGWKGEWSHRSGWQQIADAVSGVCWAQGEYLGLNEPVIPLLPNSDYQTGIAGAIAICQALYERSHKGGSYNVDVSLTQYNIWYQQIGLQDAQTVGMLRKKNPDFKARHFTPLFPIVDGVTKSVKKACGDGEGELFDPARFVEGDMRWGTEGEKGLFLDWTKIVTFGGDLELGHDRGTCKPGSDDAKWL